MKNNLIIFDEPLAYTEALSEILTHRNIFDNIEITNSYPSLLEYVQLNKPQFILFSFNKMMLSEIYTSTEEILTKSNESKIILIGNCYDVIVIRKLFNKGIKAYLDKNSPLKEFMKSIDSLKSGEIYICDYAKELMINFISNDQERKATSNVKESLTKREMEILKHICNGLSSKDICEKLFISINTVETHRKRILLKLNVKNSAGVVKYAMENNIIN